ncbi:ribosome maturation protein SBDS, putative [Phytophthora infestans T30-4]|uniref:Ribosome maturation protein SBDS, putative n=1 Tax=Phytophthora infestans (strain T30-4) TaxID=403677 RepID=D0MQP9_PHYIT|nr:ribosome maturation protein SBDS, putative [Phytophthora infestans T30-4]EEY57818.1 ribosome maturation protein SBDS, putative [Phytophthora infestans T30-4]|eukprot:XP_002909004.1 ribosome maturation protein SBDS, putative [Phytophthora infestans T30-4]
MSGRISQPVGKIVLTNVAIVRMRKGGKRFEIACYKNKVFNWRNGVEEDVDEVLQIAKVYENVSKGKFAKKSDWSKAFSVQSEEQACRAILDHGELQVSEGERKALVENMYRDIATIVADKCVNPTSNRPYPYTVIERVMKEIHYAVIPNRSAKQQALELIKKLPEHIPLARAKMKIQVTTPASGAQAIKTGLQKEGAEIVEQTGSETVRMVVLITPGSYRIVNSLVQEHTAGQGSLEVIDLKSHQEGEHTIDDEISKKTERLGLATTKKARPCSTCGGDFSADMSKYREHFRSEWHRYNLKRKSKKQPVISEEEFNELDTEDVETFLSSMS